MYTQRTSPRGVLAGGSEGSEECGEGHRGNIEDGRGESRVRECYGWGWEWEW